MSSQSPEQRNSSDTPDLMNDPAFDSNSKNEHGKSPDETDTCRICRGDGSAEEPLFYPCKCSGSIKFVHQVCLMEWLSHSQKKHCELCKTPFRFTKLYSPSMPKKLPNSVFIKKAAYHLVSHLFVWLRGLLVGSVWLLVLPWTMRSAWRLLFWVGDAGWARKAFNEDLVQGIASIAQLTSQTLDTSNASASVNPQAPLSLPPYLDIKSQTLNLTQGEDLFLVRMVKSTWHKLATSLKQTGFLPVEQYSSSVDPLVLRMAQQEQSSILSQIPLLKHLSPSPRFNRIIMDILEGQIITLSVVIAFILIFLIREWVVQQQPVIDMGAADADDALAQAGGGAQNQGHEAPHAPVAQLGEEEHEEEESQVGDDGTSDNDAADGSNFSENQSEDQASELSTGAAHQHNNVKVQELKERVAQAERIISTLPDDVQAAIREGEIEKAARLFHKDDAAKVDEEFKTWSPQKPIEETIGRGTDPFDESTDEHVSSARQSPRPHMPSRERSFIATDIERDLEERTSEERSNESQEKPENEAAAEDEQRSQDSTGSWQHVTQTDAPSHVSSSSENISKESSKIDQGLRKRKGKERARTLSPHARPDSVSQYMDSPSDTVEFTSYAAQPDEGSWSSKVESPASNCEETADSQENPFADPIEVSEDMDLTTSEDVSGLAQPPIPQPQGTSPTEQFHAMEPTLLNKVCDWFWGNVAMPDVAADAGAADPDGEDVEHVVEDLAAEAPFVPFAPAHPVPPANPPVGDGIAIAEIPAAAAQAGVDPNDPDALEDAEDLEGVLELIGMQGPITGLFQNAIFSSVLIFLSILGAVWVPYLYGKIILLTTAMPELLYKFPLRMLTLVADILIDLSLLLTGYALYLLGELYRVFMSFLNVDVTPRYGYEFVTLPALQLAQDALQRLAGGAAAVADIESQDFLHLSMSCHAALDGIQEAVASSASWIWNGAARFVEALSSITVKAMLHLLTSKLPRVTFSFLMGEYEELASFLSNLWTAGSIPIQVGTKLVPPENRMLAYWTASDRLLAIIAGYSAMAIAGALYLKIAPLASSPRGRRIESHIIELFQQAGGVLKVVLIISIEMIAFPLFCGFLLDFALMPLFESATFKSRLTFAITSPWTSGFVHWFVGTCYMFHFALFVSMCRRIMRGGVLYFIRDPDDPTFHPVRDVLERNVITQLRKIAFSAIVYGALIVVCLGGVVWSLWAASDNILPIHWTSSESSFEFPLDILFYNFLTPVIVKFTKPSDGLHAMYTWWFRRCARALRLSDFLFRNSFADEEGHHVRTTWKAWLMMKTGVVEDNPPDDDENNETKGDGEPEVYFQKDGRHVRAPASDQVRIPKGGPVFVEVDENNHRLDGKPDDEGVHSRNSDLITNVYVPPWFRLRIGLFVVAVWLFATVTGISVTIVPLLFGRKILSTMVPNANDVNDIYAFSLGIYILGGILYTALHYNAILSFLHATFWPSSASRSQALATFGAYAMRTASIVYVYASLAVGLPLLFAVLLELYILMPIHVSFGPEESHVIHLIQDWTLGILYVRIGTRILMWDRQSRAARIVQAVVHDGYLNPDARLATRAFILPTLLAFSTLMGAPFGAAKLANATYFRQADQEDQIRVMRLAYPITLAWALALWSLLVFAKATERWRMKIRDEAYLIGERLHNFGEKKAGPGASTKAVAGLTAIRNA